MIPSIQVTLLYPCEISNTEHRFVVIEKEGFATLYHKKQQNNKIMVKTKEDLNVLIRTKCERWSPLHVYGGICWRKGSFRYTMPEIRINNVTTKVQD